MHACSRSTLFTGVYQCEVHRLLALLFASYVYMHVAYTGWYTCRLYCDIQDGIHVDCIVTYRMVYM